MSTPEECKRKAVLEVSNNEETPSDFRMQKDAPLLAFLRNYFGCRVPLVLVSSLVLLNVTGILNKLEVWCQVN